MALGMTTRASLGLLLVPVMALASCGDGDEQPPDSAARVSSSTPGMVIDPGDGGDYVAELDPGDFVAEIDNPYLPLRPGSRWVYEGGEDEVERVEVVVTPERREIGGVSAVVVRRDVSTSAPAGNSTTSW
jgi:hypothetical protein